MKYTQRQKLGEGTYGSVFQAVNRETGENVALKMVRTDQEEDGIPGSSLREVSILKHLHHQNVLTLSDVICEQGKISIVFEYMGCDLRKYLARGRQMARDLLQSYSFQLLAGVAYLHEIGIVHRDVRPENLLLNRGGMLKLGDFQKATMFDRPIPNGESDHRMIHYQAPEVLIETETVDCKIDEWSAGCVIAEMARNAPLFKGDSPVDQLMKVCYAVGVPTDWPAFDEAVKEENWPLPTESAVFEDLFDPSVDRNLVDLVRKLLTMNPEKRISAREAVDHPYFQSIGQDLRAMCLDFALD